MSADAPPRPAQSPPLVVQRKGDRGKIYVIIGVVAVAAVIVGVGAGTSWYGLRPASSSSGCPTGVTVQGEGAAFPASIVSQWTSEFQGASSNIVNYAPSGAGAGITALTDKSVDFALTDEGLTSSQSSALQTAVGTFLTLPVTGGAVVVVYHIPGFSGTLNLTASQIAEIYLGTITLWNATALVANNPGLASVTVGITSIHRSDPAGMTYVLTTLMSQQNTAWRTNPSLGTSLDPSWPSIGGVAGALGSVGANGNSQMLSYEKSDAGGTIGYSDLYDAQVKSLSIASIENSAGHYIAPTVGDTTSAIDDVFNATGASLPSATGDWSAVTWVNASGAGDYPLATLVYILVPMDPGKGHTATSATAAALRQWIAWVVTQGQYYSRTSFPFPSPPAPLLVQDSNALPGMTFNGATFPSCT